MEASEKSLNRLDILYDVVYSYLTIYHRIVMPHMIHRYVKRLIDLGLIRDYWMDWIKTSHGAYSPRLGYDLTILLENRLLSETCIGNVCGFLTLGEGSVEPKRIYVAIIND